jgi:S1-C subfamily serine protease
MIRSFVVGLLLLLGGITASLLAQEGAWLGTELSSVTSATYDTVNDKSSLYSGAKVERVIANSPAAIAGLKVGDVILSVDGRKTEDADQLVKLLQQMPPESAVRVGLKRDDADLELRVVLGRRPQTN